MGLFDAIFGKKEEVADVGLEQLMEEANAMPEEPADFYVASVDLRNEGDANLVIKSLQERRIIILNIAPISKQPNRMKAMFEKFRAYARKSGADMAAITSELVLLVPHKVRIIKRKQREKGD